MTEAPKRLPSVRIRSRMSARDTGEPHRVSSPLELLFDLTFVVAIAQLVSQLAVATAEGDPLRAVGPFLMVFFAIWWAWMNFTWFASAFDTDDVPYRLLTLLQMGGVLVVAAGVPDAFVHQNFTVATIGYLIMRIGLVALWLRAGTEDAASRTTAYRYAAAIGLVQLGWLARVFIPMPQELLVPSFILLAIAELSVPLWAERTGRTTWHAHHIAERYGLFTIILLGESVAAASAGVAGALEKGVSAELITTSAAGLVLLFGLWWLYFVEPNGEGLHGRRQRSFLWGYGHVLVFASLAAIGAALEAAHEHAAPIIVGYALAVPVAAYLLLLRGLTALITERPRIRPAASLTAAVLVLLIPLLAPALGLPLVVVGIALVVALLVTVTLLDRWPDRPR